MKMQKSYCDLPHIELSPITSLIIFIYQFAVILAIYGLFLFEIASCRNPQSCDISLWVPFDRSFLPFNKESWNTAPVDSGYHYSYEKERELLQIRERMVCDLYQNILTNNMSYDSVQALLGVGYSSVPNPAFFTPYIHSDSLRKMLIDKEALLYTVGYNASGDNYLLVQFKNGKYLRCSRSEAQ